MPKTYSHSRLSTFEKCPLKFKYRYIDKIVPEIEKTIEAHLGSSVHSALEWLYQQIKNKKVPTTDEILQYYIEKWKKDFKPEILVVKKDMTAQDYFNKGIQFLIDYYKNNHPFDDNTLETEKLIQIKLNEDYKIKGFIDRLSHNPEKNEYEIHDYKTANSLPMKNQIDNDRQLALYSIAIKNAFGYDKNVLLTWHYLAHSIKIHSRRTNDQLEKLKREIIDLIQEIEQTKNFPAYISKLCDWCEYKNICPAWQPKQEKQQGLDIWD